jgi:hypothetical protein
MQFILDLIHQKTSSFTFIGGKGIKKKSYTKTFLEKIERLFENYTLPLPPIWHNYCTFVYIKHIKYEN